MPSAAHFMMTAKVLLFGDAETAERILAAPHPGAAKALGRRCGFDEQIWGEQRFDLVVTGNLAKLGQHPDLWDLTKMSSYDAQIMMTQDL
jgi:predicted NAD-dependent protein-ADP-ribosyltransferase YbiA (DUF1768 family)